MSLSQEGAEAVVRVRDNGMGLAPDLLPRVFDLYTQAERTLDRALGGLGIGLTIVRRLVEMHHGSVEARSDGPGLGSEFIVRIPLLRDELEPPTESTAAPSAGADGPGASARVLVVDDHEDSATSLSLVLGHLGHTVRTALNGQ